MSRKMRAPSGVSECNYGGERLPVDNDGTVDVPDDAVDSLTHTAGFVAIDDAPVVIPDGFVRLVSVSGASAVSWGGVSYAAGANGVFIIPVAAVGDVAPHGFDIAPGAAIVIPPALALG